MNYQRLVDVNSSDYDIIGNCEITLPDYMMMLPKESDRALGPIIACGIQPGTFNLVSLTNDGQFYELNVKTFFKTDNVGTSVYPIQSGRMLEFERVDMLVTVDSDDILNASQKIQLIDLEIGMNHENKDIDPEKNHQGGNV